MKKILIFIIIISTMLTLMACGTNPEHQHTFATTYSFDDNYHWYASTCGHSDEISGRAKHSLNLNLKCHCGYSGSKLSYDGNIEQIIDFDMYNSKYQVDINKKLYYIETFDNVVYQKKDGNEFYIHFMATSYDLYYVKNNQWEKQTINDNGALTINKYIEENYPEIAQLSLIAHNYNNTFRYDNEKNVLISYLEGQVPNTKFFDFEMFYYLTSEQTVSRIKFRFIYNNAPYEITITPNDSDYDFPEVAAESLSLKLENGYYIILGIGQCQDVNLRIPSKINDIPVKYIAADAFKNNSQIESVLIPGSIVSIGNSAFESCVNLKSIVIEQGVEHIGDYAFAHINPYSNIQFTDSIVSIGENAFLDASGYTEKGTWNFVGDINKYVQINFGKGESTPNKNRTMYHNGYKLKKVVIDTATSISAYAFNNLSSPEEYHIGKQVTSIGKNAIAGFKLQVLANGISSFKPYSVYYEGTIDEFLNIQFDGCWAVGSGYLLYCEDELVDQVIIKNRTSIPAGAFANCASLKSVDIRYGVTEIGEWAFYACPLEFVDLPTSITTFGKHSFSNDSLYSTENTVFIEENGCTYLGVGYNPYYLLIDKESSESEVHKDCLYSINMD